MTRMDITRSLSLDLLGMDAIVGQSNEAIIWMGWDAMGWDGGGMGGFH